MVEEIKVPGMTKLSEVEYTHIEELAKRQLAEPMADYVCGKARFSWA